MTAPSSSSSSPPASIPRKVNDKLIEFINEALAAENAAVDKLQSRVQECLLPEGKARLQQHLEETRNHQQRLSQVISKMGGSPTDAKVGLPKIGMPATTMMKKTMTDVAKSLTGSGDTNPMHEEMELMRTKEGFGIENVEIITYRSLIHLCQKLSLNDAVAPLQQSLREEQSMADWISENTPVTLDALWPRIEAALLGRDKDMASLEGGTGRSTTTAA
jgi:ferritin-like metal-binding protein YciE